MTAIAKEENIEDKDNKFLPIGEIELGNGERVAFNNYSYNKNGDIAVNPGTYPIIGTLEKHSVIKPYTVPNGKMSKVKLIADDGTVHEINRAYIIAYKKKKPEPVDLGTWQNYAVDNDLNYNCCIFQSVEMYRLPKAKTLEEVIHLLKTKKKDPWNDQMIIKMEHVLRDIVYGETSVIPTEELPLFKESAKVIPLKPVTSISPINDSVVTTDDNTANVTMSQEDVNTALKPTNGTTKFLERKPSEKMTAIQESGIAIAYFGHGWKNQRTLAAIAGVTDSTISRFTREIEKSPHKLEYYGLKPELASKPSKIK